MGSGGGSGYLAVMGLAGVDPLIMKPTALALNVLVTSISTWQFVRAGHFSGRHFWPIAIFSIPAAFLGGRINLASQIYKISVGLVLLYAGWRMWRSTKGGAISRGSNRTLEQSATLPIEYAAWWQPRALLLNMSVGAGIGLLSGMLGIGGGIFLSPILILTGWLKTREALGVTAAFVLLNSLAGPVGADLGHAVAATDALAVAAGGRPGGISGGEVSPESFRCRPSAPFARHCLAHWRAAHDNWIDVTV